MASVVFPTIFLLPRKLSPAKYHQLQGQIPTLTDNIAEAKLVVAALETKRRAENELRHLRLYTEEVTTSRVAAESEAIPNSTPPRQKREPNDIPATHSRPESDNDSATSVPSVVSTQNTAVARSQSPVASPDLQGDDIVKVVRLAWLEESLRAGEPLPIDEKYLLYQGRPIPDPNAATKRPKRQREEIVACVKAEVFSEPSGYVRHYRNKTAATKSHPSLLVQETTSEHDNPPPPLPLELQQPYSCCRSTPAVSQNDSFLSLLKKIQKIRKLTGDEDHKVRAYGAAMASIAACPYPLSSSHEILRLPGCSQNMALRLEEFLNTGTIQEAESLEKNEQLKVMNEFYEIFDVGVKTCVTFWEKGHRTLDDIVEHYWSYLRSTQKIGLKYYDEFLLPIPRTEVESIARAVHETANDIWKDGGYHMLIVGGYRRGKEHSGDVDIVLSHPDEEATDSFIGPLVEELWQKGHITHPLRKTTATSERGQQTLSMSSEDKEGSHGFCTLDKALVVWQDPDWPTKATDTIEAERNGVKPRNPNPHRRVDIIISPWKTVGCAVLAWSSGVQFQRDLRLYCRKVKNLKFDSSGVRRLDNGSWLDLEGPVVEVGGKKRVRDEKKDMLEAEKRVFEGLGLVWREPEERCTPGI